MGFGKTLAFEVDETKSSNGLGQPVPHSSVPEVWEHPSLYATPSTSSLRTERRAFAQRWRQTISIPAEETFSLLCPDTARRCKLPPNWPSAKGALT